LVFRPSPVFSPGVKQAAVLNAARAPRGEQELPDAQRGDAEDSLCLASDPLVYLAGYWLSAAAQAVGRDVLPSPVASAGTQDARGASESSSPTLAGSPAELCLGSLPVGDSPQLRMAWGERFRSLEAVHCGMAEPPRFEVHSEPLAAESGLP
jgi:hypothetical protein